MKRVKVWDGATRLFHWVLVCLLGIAWLSARKGWLEWHMYSGYAVGALLLFRIAWGFVGSETSRFSQFLASPFEALRHLLHLTKREPDEQVGHNAAGGWMVIVMLLLIAAQVITGLGTNDDITNDAPLIKYLSKDSSDTLTFLHGRLFTFIQIAVVAHVVAIAAYLIIKRHNLVFPMLHGHKDLPVESKAPHMAPPVRAWIVFAVAAAIMYFVSEVL